MAAEDNSTQAPNEPAVRILSSLLACTDTDVRKRSDAQRILLREFSEGPAWVEAWARFALGVSLLNENDQESCQRGLVNLIHLPARYARSQPYLAGLALATAAQAHRERGDAAAAATLHAEIERLFPNHPLLKLAEPVKLRR